MQDKQTTRGAFGTLGHMVRCSGGGNIEKLWQMLDGTHATHLLEFRDDVILVKHIKNKVVDISNAHHIPDVSSLHFTKHICFEPTSDENMADLLQAITPYLQPDTFVCIFKTIMKSSEQGYAWVLPNVLLLRSCCVTASPKKWTERCCDFLFAIGCGYGNHNEKRLILHAQGETYSKTDVIAFCKNEETNLLCVWNCKSLQNEMI